ncbi:MAG: DUF72 domain-containing protein [Candidatus Methanoperedens sp.]|nr:DUF72 domain-containing protein [Candidatus Methanoperedens sp.]MCE8429011.1 DUF72 domain-containing protein [Candidatus Methanoperedens sp.]
MSMLYIGAGGWAYFQVPGMDSLTAYAKAFNFVEVNSTFYTNPSIEMARSWRRRVPDDFMFSVRCHKDLTHKYMLFPCKESHEILARSIRICSELRSEILHIQTPPSFSPDEKIKGIRDLFSSIDLGHVKLAWEIRGSMTKETIELMHDIGIIHSTDISKEMPSTDSDILYSRLFGHGEHNLYQFDDAELLDIDKKISDKNLEKAYLTFHGARMYADAARLKVYKKTREFPDVTKSKGLESLKSVLEEDAKFPTTKSELTEKQGWKVFDLTGTERVHASILLNKLPDVKFAHIEEVIEALKKQN